MQKNRSENGLLRSLPVNLFGSVMSLTAISFAWQLVVRWWSGFHWVAALFAVMAVLCFLLLSICYALKLIYYRKEVMAEFNHPVTVNFFATFIIAVLLIPGILLPYNKYIALTVWSIGAISIFLFAWHMLRRWMDMLQEPANAIPAWFLPIVGTLDAPIVGLKLPFVVLPQVCLFLYAIGIVFTLILFPILFSRMFFAAALPDALKPTLMILIGPLALAFSGYIGFTGHVDMVASIMYYFNLFLFIVLVSKLYSLPLKTPFRLSWWAVGFPLAAFTIASLHFAFFSQTILFNGIAILLLAGTTGIILYLLIRTFAGLYQGSWEIQPQASGSNNQKD